MKTTILAILLFFSLTVTAALPNEFQVNSQIKRGGRLTYENLHHLQSLGYKTIINIDDDYHAILQEKDYAESLGFQYIANPFEPSETPLDDEIDMILSELENPANFPIYIHCRNGKDQTGLVLGLYRVFVSGWTAEQARQEMLRLGFNIRLKNLENYFIKRTKGH